MDCPEVRERLSLYNDQEADPADAQAMARHLSGCPECRREETRWHDAIRMAEGLMDPYRLLGSIDPTSLPEVRPRGRATLVTWLESIWTACATLTGLLVGLQFATTSVDLHGLTDARILLSFDIQLSFIKRATVQLLLLLLLLQALRSRGIPPRFRWSGIVLLPASASGLLLSVIVLVEMAGSEYVTPVSVFHPVHSGIPLLFAADTIYGALSCYLVLFAVWAVRRWAAQVPRRSLR